MPSEMSGEGLESGLPDAGELAGEVASERVSVLVSWDKKPVATAPGSDSSTELPSWIGGVAAASADGVVELSLGLPSWIGGVAAASADGVVERSVPLFDSSE